MKDELNKEICKNCLGPLWSETTEEFWNEYGILSCVKTIGKEFWRLITNNTPTDCPFILEHLMKEQEK